jgi:hypothetical protein
MKATGSKAADFLRQMTPEAAEPVEIERKRPAPVSKRKAKAPKPDAAPTTSRAGLKHFGAYLDDATLEKIALLRVRLKLDNSALTKRAVDDLYAKHMARRAHGDG